MATLHGGEGAKDEFPLYIAQCCMNFEFLKKKRFTDINIFLFKNWPSMALIRLLRAKYFVCFYPNACW
jgi:hypothetical protein